MQNHYFIFPILSLDYCVSALQRMGHSADDVHSSFPDWIEEHHRAAFHFYNLQFNRHSNAVSIEFTRLYGSDIDGDIYESLWDEFAEQTGLTVHESRKEHAIAQLDASLEKYYPKERPRLKRSSISADAEIEEPRPIKIHVFDELWFNSVIDNPSDIQRQLRNLPYEEYLATEHWRRVRAALLLICNARCQESTCHGLGETWLGEEDGLHVHHVTYKNRGNERYQDLRLLCHVHHKQLHEDIKAGKQTIEVLDSNTPTPEEILRDLRKLYGL
jgi:hypothetical protein